MGIRLIEIVLYLVVGWYITTALMPAITGDRSCPHLGVGNCVEKENGSGVNPDQSCYALERLRSTPTEDRS